MHTWCPILCNGWYILGTTFFVAPTFTSAIRPVYISKFYKYPVAASYTAYMRLDPICVACKFDKPIVSGAAFSGNIQISLGKLPLSVVIGCFQRDIEYKLRGSPQLLTNNMPK